MRMHTPQHYLINRQLPLPVSPSPLLLLKAAHIQKLCWKKGTCNTKGQLPALTQILLLLLHIIQSQLLCLLQIALQLLLSQLLLSQLQVVHAAFHIFGDEVHILAHSALSLCCHECFNGAGQVLQHKQHRQHRQHTYAFEDSRLYRLC